MGRFKLILANGEVLDDCQAGYADGSLWCWLRGCTMGQAYSLFSVPDNIREITFIYGSLKAIFRGADILEAIITNRDDISVRLSGDEITAEMDIPVGEEGAD